jgi:hypothetical protein
MWSIGAAPASQTDASPTRSRIVLSKQEAVALAVDQQSAPAVVRAYIAQDVQCAAAVRMLGVPAAVCAVEYLASSQYRPRALEVLALFDPPPVGVVQQVNALLARPDLDSATRYAAELLQLAANPQATEQQADQMARRYAASGVDASEWGHCFAAFRVTRKLGLTYARDGITAAIQRLAGGDPQGAGQGAQCMISMCLGGGKVDNDDLALISRFRTACTNNSKIGTRFEPVFELVEWIIGGRDPQKLDRALEALAAPAESDRVRYSIAAIFGDRVLTPQRDIPLLLGRATDRTAALPARVGAVMLLAELGPADARVQNQLIELIERSEDPLCEAATYAFTPTPDRRDRMLQAVDRRLAGDVPEPLRTRLLEFQEVLRISQTLQRMPARPAPTSR